MSTKVKPIDPADPAALAAWVQDTRAEIAALRELVIDATTKAPHRKHARAYLREATRRRFRSIGERLGALDPSTMTTPQ